MRIFSAGVISISLLFSSFVLANPNQLNRIFTDEVLQSTLHGVEKKYKVQCVMPTVSEVLFRCLNGPQCGYSFKIQCSSRNNLVRSPVIVLNVDGFDDGSKNDVNTIQIQSNTYRQ